MNSAAVGLLHKLLYYEQLLFRSVQTRRLKFHLFPATGTSNPNSLFKTRAGPVQLQFTDPHPQNTWGAPLGLFIKATVSFRLNLIEWFRALFLRNCPSLPDLFFISLPTRSLKCAPTGLVSINPVFLWYGFCARAYGGVEKQTCLCIVAAKWRELFMLKLASSTFCHLSPVKHGSALFMGPRQLI